MLVQLTIQNIVLIERLVLELGAGFNVLTGETGAGKSMLVDALALVLGGRARPDLVAPASVKPKSRRSSTSSRGVARPRVSRPRAFRASGRSW